MSSHLTRFARKNQRRHEFEAQKLRQKYEKKTMAMYSGPVELVDKLFWSPMAGTNANNPQMKPYLAHNHEANNLFRQAGYFVVSRKVYEPKLNEMVGV